MGERVSQEVVEVVITDTPDVRVSQQVIEPVIVGEPNVRVSQVPVEVVQDAQGHVRVSQETIEAILNALPGVHISQLIIEVVGLFFEVPMALIYPKLPGKSPQVKWKTTFFNLQTQVAPNGAEIDQGLADTPLHTFTVTYNFLRDDFGFQEQRLLRGFFGAQGGNRGRFQFPLDEDHQVKSQLIGTTDGSTRIYTLTRDYGVGEASWNEPIGYVDLTQPFTLYFDGVPRDRSSYTIDTTVPAQQQIIFPSFPTAGQKITVDMDYNYYCKFQDPDIDLDKFMYRLFSGDQIVIKSCRPGA